MNFIKKLKKEETNVLIFTDDKILLNSEELDITEEIKQITNLLNSPEEIIAELNNYCKVFMGCLYSFDYIID